MKISGVFLQLLPVAVIAAVLALPQSARSAPAIAPREPALVALCRVWNAVRFFHPRLLNEADQHWEDAGVAAIQAVSHDPAALQAATSAMLGTLHDPLTRVYADGKPGPIALPAADVRDGMRIVRLNGYPTDERAYQRQLQLTLTPDAGDRGIVVDLRISGSASDDQISAMRGIWSRVTLAAPVIAAPIERSVTAQRYYLGFPPEKGETSGGYREGRETNAEPSAIIPMNGARALPIAFLVDRTAVVPPEAVALASAGAGFFSTDETSGILPGSVRRIDATDGLVIALRTGAPLRSPLARPGDLETALASLQTPTANAAALEPSSDVPIAKRFADTALPDEAHRILATFRIWGTIAYADPYRDLMHDDWDAALQTAISETRAAQTALAYQLALMKQYAHIHDSHGFMAAPAVRDAYASTPSFLARDVQGHLTIVRVDPAHSVREGFRVGDIIVSVDGEAVAARARRLRPYIAASTEQSLDEMLDSQAGAPSILAGPSGSVANLMLRRGRRTIRCNAVRLPQTSALLTRTRPAIDVLPGNVGYVDLQRLELPQIDDMLARMKTTRAIIFDLRGYPRGTIWSLAPHLARHAVRTALFRTPLIREPLFEVADVADDELLNGTRDFFSGIVPQAPRLSQPIVVLIDARAISQSEHSALFLKAAAGARFVGEPTAGADGDITNIALPGGITAYLSGQAVVHPDGSQLQRVGIRPDVRVDPTVDDVRNGRDTILNAGLREAFSLTHADAHTERSALTEERRLEIADAMADQRAVAPPHIALSPDAQPLPQNFAAHYRGYDGGPDASVHHVDGNTVVLRSTPAASSSGIGTLSEALPLDAYRGKRIQVSGYLRSENVVHAAFWLRIDGPDGQMDGFDNMSNRALVGSADWTPFVIVLDVPDDAQRMLGGLLLLGRGTVWADDLHIETVPKTVATTGD